MLARLPPLRSSQLALWARRSSGLGGYKKEEEEAGRRDLPSLDAVRTCLSEASERRCRALLGAVRGCSQEMDEGRPAAGVLIPLCTVQGEPSLLLTLRSSKLKGRHKGDVSFPGGKHDPIDPDIIHTALRETHEELGIEVARDHVWGTFKPLSDWSGMSVVPVLANLGTLEPWAIRANPIEVEDVFAISIRHVCSERNRGYTRFRYRGLHAYTLPVFLNTQYKVWGLTAMMIDTLLFLLFPGAYRSLVRGLRPKIGR